MDNSQHAVSDGVNMETESQPDSWIALMEVEDLSESTADIPSESDRLPISTEGDNPPDTDAFVNALELNIDQHDQQFLAQQADDAPLSPAAPPPTPCLAVTPILPQRRFPPRRRQSTIKRRRRSTWKPLPLSLGQPEPLPHYHDRAPTGLISFMLLAIQSDPTIMYRHDERNFDERVRRSINHTCGMTIVALDHRDRCNLRSEGLCLRSQWRRVDPVTYRAQRAWLIFRDKFCNYRNFRDLYPYVKWPVPLRPLRHGSFNKFPVRGADNDNETTAPSTPINSMASFYRFRPVRTNPIPENMALASNNNRSSLAPFYHEIIRFIVNKSNGAAHVRLYHRLPQNMYWLSEEIEHCAANLEQPFTIECVKMHGRASAPYISAHCLHRPNHNTITCEICLFEAYLPQLINEITQS